MVPEILLIHTVSQPQIRYGRLLKAAGRTAPLGVACLASAFPERVTWLDLQTDLPEIRDAASVEAGKVKAVVVQAASDWDEERSAEFAGCLARLFPEATRILGGEIRPRYGPHWDLLLHGTGRVLLRELLAGNELGRRTSKVLKTLPEDLLERLPVPSNPLPDNLGYSASVEKCMEGPTISIYQPWTGLMDRTRRHGVAPRPRFLEDLLPWLRRSGFGAASFEAPVFSARHYCDLQEACAHQGMPFSLALADPEEAAGIAQLPQGFLWRIWLKPDPAPEGLSTFARIPEYYSGSEVSLGLRLARDAAGDPELGGLAPFCDELSIENPEEWEFLLLRRTLVEFYLRQKHLWKRILRLRSARELLTFLRGAYGIFDLLIRK